MKLYSLFLSYSSHDSTSALSLKSELRPYNIEAWVYEVDARPGISYLLQTGQAIANASAFAILVSRQSLASNQLTAELVRAHEEKKLLLPILVDVDFREVQLLAPEWRQALSSAVAIDSRRHSTSELCNLIARSIEIHCASSQSNFQSQTSDSPTSPLFSESIRTTFREVGKKIEVLTQEQIRAFRALNGARRLKVAGCAGSGKTMLLAEKAIRLSNAGLRVLVLCHNPNLAAFISRLTEGVPMDVFSFSSWIARALVTSKDLSRQLSEESAEWQIYDEPDEATLEAALSAISRSSTRYDAILVDEAQDFRDTWWIPVEGALAHSDLSFFYIFFDDHQNLVPARFGAFPFQGIEALLSRNVRNAGKVFNVVKYYHPAAPKADSLVESEGYVAHVRGYKPELGLRKTLAILDAFGADTSNTVFLYGQRSRYLIDRICSLRMGYTRGGVWQEDAVFSVLERLARDRNIRVELEKFDSLRREVEVNLSLELHPTPSDLAAVDQLFAEIAHHRPVSEQASRYAQHKESLWRSERGSLLLDIEEDKLRGTDVPMFYWSEPAVLQLYRTGLPLRRLPSLATRQQAMSEFRFHDVGTYKGLEAEAVVVVSRGSDLSATEKYVATSRARSLLVFLNFGNNEVVPSHLVS